MAPTTTSAPAVSASVPQQDPTGATVPPAWHMVCKRCSQVFATCDQVHFLRENEQSFHLALRKHLLYDEQVQQRDSDDAELQRKRNWKVLSYAHVTPPMQFFKSRTRHARKQRRAPYEVFCSSCQFKIASECRIDERPGTEYLLDSRNCECVIVAEQASGNAGNKVRKWGLVFKKLELLRLPVCTETAVSPITLEIDERACVSQANGTSENDIRYVSKRQQSLSQIRTGVSEQQGVVLPTEESIRRSFSPTCNLTPLRPYQVEMALSALLENTIVYLPTGAGKTLVAVKVIDEIVRLNPGLLAVFFVPTGPLVTQQAAYIRRETELTVLELSGQHNLKLNARLSQLANDPTLNVLVVTPQYFSNLVFRKVVAMSDFSIMVFDEAHHATGDHPYQTLLQNIATTLESIRPRLLALTASPFGESKHVESGQEAISRLSVYFSASVNTPTLRGEDLKSKLVPKDAQWVVVQQSDSETLLRTRLRNYTDALMARIAALLDDYQLPYIGSNYDVDDLELTQFFSRLRTLQERAQQHSVDGDLELIIKHVRSIASSFFDLSIHGATHVAKALHHHFKTMGAASQPVSRHQYSLIYPEYKEHLLSTVIEFQQKYAKLGRVPSTDDVSSRVQLIADILDKANFTYESRAIVFVRRRKTAIELAKAMEKLKTLKVLNPTRFIGHNSYEGMSWEDEQKPTLERFRQGRIRLLVATNVLEEGLDVPECSLVVLFDGIKSVTSLIQSRGRARRSNSTFVVFCPASGVARQQHLVESEAQFFTMAKHVASRIPSKSVVGALLDYVEHDKDDQEPTAAEPKPRAEVKTVRVLLDPENDAENMYSVTLGSAFDHDEAFCDQLVRELDVYTRVRCTDQQLGLWTLEPISNDDIDSSYHKLCKHLSFVDEQSEGRFWMKFENVEADSKILQLHPNIDDRLQLQVLGMQRGMWSQSSGFVPITSVFPENGLGGKLSLQGTHASIAITSDRSVTLDLRQVCDSVVWFDSASSVDEVSVFVSLLVPPHFYQKKVRVHADCQDVSLVFRIRVHCSSENGDEIWKLRLYLMKLSIEVRDTQVSIAAITKDQAPFLDGLQSEVKQPSFLFEVAYAFQCFQSRVSYFTSGFLPADFFDILAGLERDVQEQALLTFQPRPALLTMQSKNEAIADSFQQYIRDEWLILKGINSKRQQVVYKVVVTPTRVIFRPPEVAPSNRVFRHFGSENFMYVYFRDEDMDRLDYTSAGILKRLQWVMKDGISIENVEGGERHFQFLGSSLSQMRNSSCLFTTLDPHVVRNWIGDLSSIKTAAKYLKRMSQAFSSTKPAFYVEQYLLDNPADDFERHGYIFTDGCGEISKAGASKIAEALNFRPIPSAFQIRLGGAKGVLVVSDVCDALEDEETCLLLRKSMTKFRSQHNMLEVVSCAGRSVAYLTRQSIQILNSLGIQDEVFLKMQDGFLEEISSIVASDSQAFFALKGVLPSEMSWWIEIFLKQLGVSLLSDGFLASLVNAMYRYNLANTVLRARIPIRKGRTLMGVADFTGTLKYGEVFVQYTEKEEETDEYLAIVLDDVDVAVHRNPCHHSGDIRVLRCRSDVPAQLHRLKDCIVFPCDGPRPHPDECTGGDLDGDVFTVIWDERLIPQREKVYAPMDFPDSTADKKENVNDQSLIAFYLKSIQCDILGVASNAHLAVCDYSSQGIFDKGALELAQICSLQVDHDRADDHLQRVRALAPKIYPDFMQNGEKGSYPSKKVLGLMYRRCNAVMEATMQKLGEHGAHVDNDMLADGYEGYLDTAIVSYRQYKHQVASLLLASGANSEAELALGMIVEPESLYKAEYFRFGEQFKETFAQLQQSARSEFSAYFEGLPGAEMRKAASAWYYVAYSDSDLLGRCLSFPWVVIDILGANMSTRTGNRVRKTWMPIRAPTRETILPDLQISLLAEIQVKTDELLSDLFDRMVAMSSLKSSLAPHFNSRPFELILFGSSALLTFEKQSDLDVVMYSNDKHSELGPVAKFLNKSFSQVEHKPNLRVPLLSFSYEQWAVEMSRSKSGPLKTRLFRTYMTRYQFFWPCIYFLVRWGKCVGVIRRRSGGGLNLFTPTGFMWLFLRFCVSKGYVEWIDWRTITLNSVLKENSIDAEISFWTEHLTKLVSGREDSTVSAARVLLSFLLHYADLETPLSEYAFEDPFDESNDTQLTELTMPGFREKCYVAGHLLLISRGDINCLLKHQKDQTSKVTLSRALSKRVCEAKSFWARKILFDSNASAETELAFARHPNSLRPDLYVAEIKGNGESVQRIEEKLERIEKELGAPNFQRSNQSFHREGSSLLLFEGAVSQNDQIGFQEYFGDYHTMHSHTRLHQAHLVCFMNGMEWYDHASTCFSARFVQQMIKLTRFEKIHTGSGLPQPKADAFIRFGHHYLIHLPRSFHDETIALASIKTLEEEFERGRTARELYESVLVAKQAARKKEKETETGAFDENMRGEGEDDNGAFSGGGGGGIRGLGDGDEFDTEYSSKKKKRKPPMPLERATTAMKKDKGATHSFYTQVEQAHGARIANYAFSQKQMVLASRSESYGASIVCEHVEYIIKLTPDLQFKKLKTRPSRWFSATLKMRQELDEERGEMDSTPDIRFYVSTTEQVPITHPLHVTVTSLCSKSPNGRGILDFVDEETRAKVRLSDAMLETGEKSGVVPTVRHVIAETYECPRTGLLLSLMRIQEFTIPSMDPAEGFLGVTNKIEAEFVMPSLTAERRHDPAFAREFLATGVEFVEFLRSQSQLSPENVFERPDVAEGNRNFVRSKDRKRQTREATPTPSVSNSKAPTTRSALSLAPADHSLSDGRVLSASESSFAVAANASAAQQQERHAPSRRHVRTAPLARLSLCSSSRHDFVKRQHERATSFVTPTFGSARALTLSTFVTDAADLHYAVVPAGHAPLDASAIRHAAEQCSATSGASKVSTVGYDPRRQSPSPFNDGHVTSQVVAASTVTVAKAQKVERLVDGLQPNSSYDVYFVAEVSGSNGVFGGVQSVLHSTTHPEPPAVTITHIVASNDSATSLELNMTMAAPGRVYLALVPSTTEHKELLSAAAIVNNGSNFQQLSSEPPVVFALYDQSDWTQLSSHKSVSGLTSATEYDLLLVTEAVGSGGVRSDVVRLYKVARTHALPPNVVRLTASPQDASAEALAVEFDLRFDPQDVQQATLESLQFFTFNMRYEATRLPAKPGSSSPESSASTLPLEPVSTLPKPAIDSAKEHDNDAVVRGVFTFGNFSSVEEFHEQLMTTQRGVIPGLRNGTSYRVTLVAETASSHGLVGKEKSAAPCKTHERAPRILTASARAVNGSVSALHVTVEMERSGGNVHYLIVPRAAGFSIRSHFHEARSMKHLVNLVHGGGSRDGTEILHGTVEFSANFGTSQENSSHTTEFQIDGLRDATAYTLVVMPETHRSQGVFGRPFEQPLEAQTNENASEVLLVAAEPVVGSTSSLELFVKMTKPNDVLYYCFASSTSNEADDTCLEANRSTFQMTSRGDSSGFSFAVGNLTKDTRYSISVYAENAQRNQVFSAKSEPQVHVKTHKRAPALVRIEPKPVAASTDRIMTSVATAETCLVHYAIIEALEEEEDEELQSTGRGGDSNSEPVVRNDLLLLPSPETIIKERMMLHPPLSSSSSQSQRHVHFVAQGRVFARNALASFATEKLRANTTYTLFVTTETSLEGNASGVYGKVQKQSVTTFAVAPKIIKATVDPTVDRTDSVFITANLSAPGVVHYLLSDVDFADPAVIRKPSSETAEADGNIHTMAAALPQPPHVLRGQFHIKSQDMAMEIINGTNDSRPVEPLMFVNNHTVQGLRSGATYHVSLTTETLGSEGVFGEFPPPILVTTHLSAPKILAPPSGSGSAVVRPKRGSSDTLAIEMELSRFGEVHYALFFRELIPDRSTAVFEEQWRLRDLEEQSQRNAENNGNATNSSEPAHVWPPIASDYGLSSLNASMLKAARLEDLGPGVWENGTISVSREDVLKGKLTVKELSKLPPNAVFDICIVSETAGSDGIFDWEDSDHACHRVQTHAEYSNQSMLLDEISVRAIDGQTDSVRIELAMSKLLGAPADTSRYKENVLERFAVATGRVPHFVLADGKEARKEFQYNPFGSSHHSRDRDRDHQSASGLKGAVAGIDGVAAAGILTKIISENASFLILSQEIHSLTANQPYFLFFAYETSGSDGVFTRVNPHKHRSNDSKTENDGIEVTTHENAPTLTKLATVPTFGNTSTVTIKFDISCASCTEAVVYALVYPKSVCTQPPIELLSAFDGGGDRGSIENLLVAESEEAQRVCGSPLVRRKFVIKMHEREHKQSNVEREHKQSNVERDITINEDEGPQLQPNTTYSVFLATETAQSKGVLSDRFIETKVTTSALAPAFKYVRVTPRKGSTTELLFEFELERPGEVHYMAGVSGNPELNVTSPYNVSRRGRPEKDALKVHEYPRDVVRMQRSIKIDRIGERRVEVLDYLVAGTSYDVFVVAETAESNGIYGAVLEFSGVATHANPPILLAHSAYATSGSMKSLTVGFRVDAPGSVHFSVVEVDVWSPAKHVARDSDFYGNKLAVQERLVAQESLVVASDKSAGDWREVNISVPRPGTNYTVYLVTETTASDGVFGAVASHRDVRSYGEPPTVLKLSVTPADARIDALNAQIQLTEAGHVHYVVLPHQRRLSERQEAGVAQGIVDVVSPVDQENLLLGNASVPQVVVPYEAAFTIEQLKEGSVYDLYFRCETLHSNGVLGSWTHFPISARTHGLPPDVLEEVDCAVSPSCDAIGREPCARIPNVCGECLEGFEGASGSSNEPCSRTEGFNIGSGKKKTIKISGVRVNPLAWLESEQPPQQEPQEQETGPERTEVESKQQPAQRSEPEHTESLQIESQEQQQQQEEEESAQDGGEPEPPAQVVSEQQQESDHEPANQTLSELPEPEANVPPLEPESEVQAEQEAQPDEEENDVIVAAEHPEAKATSTSVPAETPLEMTAEEIIACPQHAHMVAPGQCVCQHGYELNMLTDTCEVSLLEVEEEELTTAASTASVLESSSRHSSESRSI